MIPIFYQQVIGAFVRAAIIWLAAWVAAHGGPKFTDNEIGKVVAEATPVVLVVLWSVYQKYHSRQKLMIAMASPSATSENHIEMTHSTVDAPSVLTPPHEIPVMNVK